MTHPRVARLTAAGLVTLLLAGLLTVLAAAPAQAGHAGGFALEITPELGEVSIGSAPASAGITAKLVNPVTGAPAPATADILIAFEIVGGPATSAAPSCSISVGATECAPAITARTSGTSLIRGWIVDTPTADTYKDATEGRLSAPVVDCAGEADTAACTAAMPEPGGDPERDQTDVVSVTFTTTAVSLDCGPEQGKTPHTEDATITCTVLDLNDAPLSGQTLDAENLGGANDPDAPTADGAADYDDACVTEADGTCALTIASAPEDGTEQNQPGAADICVWVDTNDNADYAPAGTTAADGAQCDEGRDATENADTADVVSIDWQRRVPTSIDVAPDIPSSSPVGSLHTLTATIFDQFSTKWTASNTLIEGEFFTASPRDQDGNTPATPDLGTCNTTLGDADADKASCTFTYSSPTAGTDVMCFWFGDDPVMSGSGTGATCTSDAAGEKLVGGTDAPKVDVVSKSWTASNTTTTTTTTTTQPPAEETPAKQGYTLVGSDGGIFTYGTSRFHGSTGDLKLNEPVIGLANKVNGTGYWLVARDGGIFSFGDAQFFGSTGAMKLNAPILGMEATPTGKGYYLFAADGGIFTFGDAVFHGSTGDRKLNAPAVGLAVNEKGDGYWLVAQDGGIFSFGGVPFHGSTGDRKLNQPVFDMTPTAGDKGYWLVAKDGGIFSFGDAENKFYGSAVGQATAPVIGIGATPSFNGYWIADAKGAVFPFGDATFLGDRRSATNNATTVGFATVPT